MTSAEVPLAGGRTTAGVARAGAAVRRPTGPHSAFVRELLAFLEQVGFLGAPRFLGSDSAGRELLSYLDGDPPTELGIFSDSALAAAARLLRALHDAAGGSIQVRRGRSARCETRS